VDFKSYDKARRDVTPLQLDLVEGYAQGRISRKYFMQRGALLGLSVPVMGAIVTACGGSDTATTPATSAGGGGTTAAGGPKAGGTIRVAYQRPKKLDPIGMQDLGTYGVIAQCFEYLAGPDPKTGDIMPVLAESWTPNADGSVWTFKLRSGVKWQSGTAFTSADVAATFDRLVASGNSGLKGVIAAGSVNTSDPATAVVTLQSPNGNFPYLVSIFNPQAAITPAAYAAGTELDKQPDGTGPWKLSKFDPQSGATFVRNDGWWGGKTPLDSVEMQFFDDSGTMMTALEGGSVDAVEQITIIGGDAVLNDANVNVLAIKSTQHRQVWMRCDKGQFADKRVRQALALTFDRPAMVETLFKGKAEVANDHVIAPFMPSFDSNAAPQRTQDIAKAKQLLSDAGHASGLKAKLNAGKLLEIPDLAALIKSGAAQAGIELELNIEDNNAFYGDQWCPAKPADPPCSGAAELGIVDYGHRPTPDVFLNAAYKSKGAWNSSQYMSPTFDAAFADYQKAVDLAGHTAACTKLEQIMNEDVPAGIAFFFDYVGAVSKKFNGVYATALGQMFFEQASQA
jgi:peptide/nickel transport system substrate-binding protein